MPRHPQPAAPALQPGGGSHVERRKGVAHVRQGWHNYNYSAHDASCCKTVSVTYSITRILWHHSTIGTFRDFLGGRTDPRRLYTTCGDAMRPQNNKGRGVHSSTAGRHTIFRRYPRLAALPLPSLSTASCPRVALDRTDQAKSSCPY